METTDFEDVLREAAQEVTALDPDNLDLAEFKALRRSAKARLEQAWEYHYWPDLQRLEQRFYRPLWGSTVSYAAGTEVYFPPSQKYYQALTAIDQSTTPSPPAALSGGQYQTDFGLWALSSRDYSGSDFDSTATYDLGAIARNPSDGLFYQKIGGLSLSGAGTADVNGTATRIGTANNKPIYRLASGQIMYWDLGDGWRIYSLSAGGEAYHSTQDVATPDLVTSWTPVLGVAPGPTFSTQGDISNAAFWGLLTPFDQYVSYTQTGQTAIGLVAGAWNANPRTSTRGAELNWFLSNNGVQISTGIAFAWIDYRIRCPKLSGDVFSSTATYSSGKQIYFSSAATPGNFYTANASTSAGQSPDTTPSKWDVVQLPRIFHKFLVHAVAADWLRGPGGGSPEDAAVQLSVALSALEDQKTLLVGQQSQRIKTVVRTR